MFRHSFLLLWDIDGTLITSGGASLRALRHALNNVFGIAVFPEGIEYAGCTDRWIIRQIFARCKLPENEANFCNYMASYLEALPEEMAKPGARVLPGVRALLEAAPARGTVAQGLLTGNSRRAAEIKLCRHGLWHHFPFGAFGDDSEKRDDLGRHGLRRARETHGIEFAPAQVWVIGDTPHDIRCARAIGANSLAVATGGHSVAELAAHEPTAILPDLVDSAAFWSIIGG
jgi:phosphoglycolate phosphatase-like HAD superfamily hydrolase